MILKKVISFIIFFVVISLMLFGCGGIERKIENAGNKCEDEIAKILENVGDICLTKEEILDLVRSIRHIRDIETSSQDSTDTCYEI